MNSIRIDKFLLKNLKKIISSAYIKCHTSLKFIYLFKLQRTIFCLFLYSLSNKNLKTFFYSGSTASNIYNYYLSPHFKSVKKNFIESYVLKNSLIDYEKKVDTIKPQLIIFIYLHPYEFDKKLSNFISVINNSLLVNAYIKYLFANDIFYTNEGEVELHPDFACNALKKLVDFLDHSDVETQKRILTVFANYAQLNIPLMCNSNLKNYMVSRSCLLKKYVKIIYPDLKFLKKNRFDKPNSMKITMGIIRFSSDSDSSESRQVYEGLANPPNNMDIFLFSFDTVKNTNKLLQLIPELKGRIINLPQNNLHKSLKIIRSYNLHYMVNTSPLSGRFLNEISIILMCRIAYNQLTLISDVITSGIKEVDYFVISKVIATKKMQEQFVEKLMVLNNIPGPLWLTDANTISNTSNDFEHKKELLFISNAHLFKLSPNLINIWAKILQKIPNSKIILLPFPTVYFHQYKFNLKNIIKEAAKINRIDHERFIIKDTVGSNNVCREISKCDIYLDSFPYSSSISLHDPLSARIPIVSLYGEFFRSRMSLSVLTELGLDKEMLVSSVDEYILLAEKLSLDSSYRRISSKMIDNSIKKNSKFFKSNSLNFYSELINLKI